MSDTDTKPEIDRSKVMDVYANQGARAAASLAGVSERTIQRWAAVDGVKGKPYEAPILRPCPSPAAYARGCRCEECAELNREHQRDVKARRVAFFRKHGTMRDGSPIPHGVSGYSNWDCRCGTCKTAWSEYLREHRG